MQNRKQISASETEAWIKPESTKAEFTDTPSKIHLNGQIDLERAKLDAEVHKSTNIAQNQMKAGRRFILVAARNYLNSTSEGQLESNRLLLNETIRANKTHLLNKTLGEKMFGSKIDHLLTSAAVHMGDKYEPKYAHTKHENKGSKIYKDPSFLRLNQNSN